jgi:Autotransporter beta-domain
LFSVSLGLLHTHSNFDSAIGEGTTSGASVSLFGTYCQSSGCYIEGIANIGWNKYNTDRNVTSGVANGSTRGTQGACA